MRKETYYFSHDFGARNDPKLQEVLMEYGVSGLGIFWCIIELLYEQGGKIPLRSIKTIAFSLHVSADDVEGVIKKFDLFKHDDDCFWSESVLNRLKKRDDANESRRQKRIAYIRKQKESQLEVDLKSTKGGLEDDLNKSVRKGKKRNPKTLTADSDGKEENSAQDVNESNQSIRFKPPTIEEVCNYIMERKSPINPDMFWNFYESKGWMIGKNKVKNWKACVRTWENKEKQNGNTKNTESNGVPIAGYGRVCSNGQERH